MDQRVVLVVDDDPMIVKALCRILEGAGFSPHGCESPIAAISWARSHAPGLIVADYMMPAMNGVELLLALRELHPTAPRLLLTAVSDFKIAMEAVNAGGVYRLLTKPWTQAELVATIQQAWDVGELRRANELLQNELAARNAELLEINYGLEATVKERASQLLEGMVQALDFRDTETQWHSRRVSLYARRLARAIGLSGTELVDVEIGALLHDVGKIGVRDSVLLKPAPLTPDEWVEMKRHPDIGFKLLGKIPWLAHAAQIVLEHQERWDGKGYPRALAGEQISLGARIFSIVDALDAICSDRPYRKGSSLEVALAELARCGGKQFDPTVLEAFLAVPPAEWEAIRLEIERRAKEAAAEEDRVGAPALSRLNTAPLG